MDLVFETINDVKDTIKNLKNVTFKQEELLYKLISHSQQNCPHDWVRDSIDRMDNYSESNVIDYCSICELTDVKT
tara:strand:+ start:19706 stop:19930 length:225 start_codon:yes stop_codon:yes gene_type:complete